MATITNRNGVDVDRLVATVGAVQGNATLAKFTFRARSSWETGGRNRGQIREFEHAGATNAYHESFGSAMLSGIDNPTPGCWEITGVYEGRTTLSIVVQVTSAVSR